MTTQTDNTLALLRDLCAAMITKPAELRVWFDRGCFSLRCHPDDESRLVGIAGSHVKALAFLTGEFGQASGIRYQLRLITENTGKRQTVQTNAPLNYDTWNARELLTRIVNELPVGEFIVAVHPVGQRGSNLFAFNIITRTTEDYHALIVPSRHALGETIVGAIGTLFRAIAKKDGVEFRIQAEQP